MAAEVLRDQQRKNRYCADTRCTVENMTNRRKEQAEKRNEGWNGTYHAATENRKVHDSGVIIRLAPTLQTHSIRTRVEESLHRCLPVAMSRFPWLRRLQDHPSNCHCKVHHLRQECRRDPL